jgi:flagellar protein FlaG
MEINRTGAAQQPAPAAQVDKSAQEAPASALTPSTDLRLSRVGVEQPKAIEDAELEDAVKTVNKFISPITDGIEFSIDLNSGKTLVKLIDRQTNEVLRQFPSKEMLAISKELIRFQGLLVSEIA